MKKIPKIVKYIFQVVWFVFELPAMVIHELMHAVVATLFTAWVTGVKFDIDLSLGEWEITLSHYGCWDWRDYVICFAPFLSFVIPFILMFTVGADWTVLVFLYQLVAIRAVLPSDHDIKKFREMVESRRTYPSE